MKNFFFSIALLLPCTAHAQQWVTYPVDSIVTVTIPEDFEIIDTLGQHGAMTTVENGMIMVAYMFNEGEAIVNIEDKNDLISFYKNFQIGFTRSQNGELIREEPIDIENLNAWRFSFRTVKGEEQQIRHCIALYIGNKTYAFTFWELESMTDEMEPVREKFFGSVQLSKPLTLKDQISYNPKASASYKIGYLIGQALWFGFLIVLIIFIVRWVSKKIKKNANSN